MRLPVPPCSSLSAASTGFGYLRKEPTVWAAMTCCWLADQTLYVKSQPFPKRTTNKQVRPSGGRLSKAEPKPEPGGISAREAGLTAVNSSRHRGSRSAQSHRGRSAQPHQGSAAAEGPPSTCRENVRLNHLGSYTVAAQDSQAGEGKGRHRMMVLRQ